MWATKKPGRSVLLMVAITMGLTGLSAGTAQAACRNEKATEGSVDGDELAYGDNTKYNDELAAADRDWSELKSIDVFEDTPLVYEDVSVNDENDPSVDWSGLWVPSSGTHEIYINSAYVDEYDNDTQQAVVEHEFGHALRLGHRASRSALMYCSDDVRVPTSPARSDIKQYRNYWG